MTSTAEMAAVAKSVAEARPPWGAICRATTAATAVVPIGEKSVGVSETSCQKSVEVDQLMQRAEEQLRNMKHQGALRFLEKLRERCMNGWSR